jgi:phosphoglycerate dehydrogenase-like enzyme
MAEQGGVLRQHGQLLIPCTALLNIIEESVCARLHLEEPVIPVFAGAEPTDAVRRAVRDGGGELVAVEQAEVVVWQDHTGSGLAAALEHGRLVRWVQLGSVGVDWLFEQSVFSDRYVWTCAKGDVFADSVAEMALLLLLSGFREMRRYVGAARWLPVAGKPLSGARICIVGGGGIGASLTAKLQPFDTAVTIVRRTVVPVPGAAAVRPPSGLLDAVRDADAVVLAVPLTSATRGMVDRAVLAAMKPGAWLVNVARGGLVDTAALLDALECGHLGGAALDVTDPEPLPEGHPLWSHPRAIITPHVSVNDALLGSLFGRRVQENLRRWVSSEPLLGRVDPSAGY